MSEFNPHIVRLYKWGYAWEEIKKLYIQKNKEYAERTNAFCSFLVELTSAALGGGKKDDQIALDDGEGIDELTDEQLAEMRIMLGEEDFQRLYGQYV